MSIQVKNAKSITLGGQQVKQIKDTNGNVLWKKVQFWWEDTAYLNSLTVDDVGTENEVEVNGVIHKVRLIGVDHDDLVTGGKAHTTWEFVDLISDANGYSLATYWKNTNTTGGSNQDYLNSSVRKAIDGQGNGDCSWFEKDSKSYSTRYTGSVLSMLPAALQAVLKNVTKQVATGSGYGLTNYNTKLFQLSYREMTQKSSSYAKEEGTTYQYYKNNDNDNARIKYQVKWHDGARTSSLSGKDVAGAYTGTKYSYAGYNHSIENYGCIHWLRSPITGGGLDAWNVLSDGGLSNYYVYYNACPVAPAFCL